VIPEQVFREEEGRAFCRQGLYLKRLRYFTDGLAVGSEVGVREWITRLRRQGRYLRRRHPILHGGLACLREQRSLVLHVVT